ncbi:hypothetical protein [uncultured Clostridium sp.]|uniref:hypothetical protein n=1 Tax=uncultured Clostridium sp. TaxID=59620 RepID=UPI00280AD099|nr:hypothetical protein [uncultured Clostridium sp.]
MNFISMILSWINLISFIILAQGIRIISGKYTPIFVKEKLEGTMLQSWRKIRFIACVLEAIGFYSFTLSENLNLDVKIKLIISIAGLILMFIGGIITIRNNIKKIGRWSSSI